MTADTAQRADVDTTACARCQAPAGQPCINTLTGQPLPAGYHHADRWLARGTQ